MKIINGWVDAFCETGTEGPIWIVQDENFIDKESGMWMHEGINFIEDGDFLLVYSSCEIDFIEWEGVICYDKSEYWRGIPKGVTRKSWSKLMSSNCRAVLIKDE